MIGLKKALFIFCACAFVLLLSSPALTQDGQPQEKKFFLFKKFDALDKRIEERNNLKERHKAELKELRKRKKEEKAKFQADLKKLREAHKQDAKNLHQKQEELRKQSIETEKQNKVEAKIKEAEQKAYNLEVEGKLQQQEDYYKEISKAKRSITVLAAEEDPLLIVKADVQDGKTAFLKMNEVEFTYKVKLKNQTPKIIDRFSFTWQRKLPFDESLNFKKETSVSKPLIPYEDRVVQYNELDYEREGEIYLVKVDKVIFQDGTQWINPAKF